MKKIFIIIWIVFSVISVHAITIDERKTDVYFGNGVWNDDKDAETGRYALETFIYLNFNRPKEKVKLAFNESYGGRRDLIETFYQLKELGQISAGYFHVLSNIMTPEYLILFQDVYISGVVSEEETDLSTIVADYQNDINTGHKVILVSHSQGNLFGLRAFNRLDSWQQNYFRQVSIATPASKVAHDGSWITDSGDIVIKKILDLAIIGTNSLNANTDNTISLPDISGHEFILTYLHGNDTSSKIKTALDNAFVTTSTIPSQWVVVYEDDTTEVCEERRATLEHFRRAVTPIDAAYPFNTVDGKVYQIGGEYVLASVDGTKILNVQTDVDDKCYELEGTANPDVISIENTCLSSMFNAKAGILESSLSWKSPEIDLALSVSFGGADIGTLDIQSSDGQCPNEHWYIATEDEVQEGTYIVSIKNSSTASIDPNLFPQTISFSVSSPGGGVEFSLDIENVDDLNMGAVAKVTVTKKATISGGGVLVSVETTEVVKSNPSVKAGVYVTTAEGTRYDYKTESLLNQVKFGPIAGAIFEVSQFVDSKGVLYSGATSSGNSIEDNGLMLFPSLLKDAVDDDNLYLITARGGQDVDANDDFIMDDIPTINLGEIHAIVSGANIKNGSLKVNIMTEIAYQVFSQSSEMNLTKIKLGLDTIAQKLLKDDINSDKTIDRADLHAWLPGFDKGKLHVNYSTDIEPIVQKIYHNEDISLDVNALVPSLMANAGEDISIGQTQTLTLDASKSYDINGNIINYLWSDGYSVICQADKPICEPEMLDFGKHLITLTVTDNDGNTAEDFVSVNINSFAPVADAGMDQEIFAIGNITFDASSSYDSDGEIVEYTWSLNGATYCQGSDPVCVIENLPVSDYTFTLTVTDDEGLTGKDYMNITYPYKPIASAGSDVSIAFGETVVLDAAGSYDNDGYIVKYSWEKSGEVYCVGTESTCIVEGLRSGTHLFKLIVTDDYGTTGYDFIEVKVVSKPYTIGSYDTSGNAYNVTISADGTIAYVADGSSGIQIIDISNPIVPILVGNYKTPGGVSDLTSSDDGKTLYIADANSGLIILDISNPVAPVLVGSYTAYQYAKVEISNDGNTAYLSGSYSGLLLIIDISDPSAPLLLGNYNTSGYTPGVTISADGTVAYVANYFSGFQIIDISDPQAPFLLSNYDTPGYTLHIELSSDESIAYIADYANGLLIFDVSNPATPYMIGRYYNTAFSAVNIKLSVDGTVAYVTDSYRGVHIIDISDPQVPFLLSTYDTPGTAINIKLVQNDTIMYVADGSSGLQIIDISAFAH